MTHHPVGNSSHSSSHSSEQHQVGAPNSNGDDNNSNNNGLVVKNPEEPFYKSVDFKRFLRFGIIDTSILMLSLVAGVSIEGYIAKKIGVHGFGTIVGAAIGNSASDTIAAMPEGWKASMGTFRFFTIQSQIISFLFTGAFTGSISPTIPIFACLFMKRPLNTKTKYIIGVSSVGLLIPSFFMSVPTDGGHH